MNPWPIGLSAGAVAAAALATWGSVGASSELFGPVISHAADANTLALTFDDGPNPAVTPQLLDELDRHSARATFFLIGQFARACPELVREISARGHLLGNHTETHPNLIFQSRTGIREELARCQEAIATAIKSKPPRWMRPPYGYRNPLLEGEVRRAGLRGVVMWSLLCGEWKHQSAELLIRKLGRIPHGSGRQGDIVVLHDGDHHVLNGNRQHVVAALAHWLPRWRDAGLKFVTIEESVPRPENNSSLA